MDRGGKKFMFFSVRPNVTTFSYPFFSTLGMDRSQGSDSAFPGTSQLNNRLHEPSVPTFTLSWRQKREGTEAWRHQMTCPKSLIHSFIHFTDTCEHSSMLGLYNPWRTPLPRQIEELGKTSDLGVYRFYSGICLGSPICGKGEFDSKRPGISGLWGRDKQQSLHPRWGRGSDIAWILKRIEVSKALNILIVLEESEECAQKKRDLLHFRAPQRVRTSGAWAGR